MQKSFRLFQFSHQKSLIWDLVKFLVASLYSSYPVFPILIILLSLAGEEQESPTQVDDQSLLMAEADLRELEFRARALKSLVIARERQQKLEKEDTKAT